MTVSVIPANFNQSGQRTPQGGGPVYLANTQRAGSSGCDTSNGGKLPVPVLMVMAYTTKQAKWRKMLEERKEAKKKGVVPALTQSTAEMMTFALQVWKYGTDSSLDLMLFIPPITVKAKTNICQPCGGKVTKSVWFNLQPTSTPHCGLCDYAL